MASESPKRRARLDSYTLYHMPEFRALCEKIGIAWERLTAGLVIRIPFNGLVMIEHEYQASLSPEDYPPPIPIPNPDGSVDGGCTETSCLHNQVFKTYQSTLPMRSGSDPEHPM